MKNTNKFLTTAIALAIALCASVQVSAMNEGRKVNPKLSKKNKELLEMRINNIQNSINDPRTNYLEIGALKNRLERTKNMYYGNYPYTEMDILGADRELDR